MQHWAGLTARKEIIEAPDELPLRGRVRDILRHHIPGWAFKMEEELGTQRREQGSVWRLDDRATDRVYFKLRGLRDNYSLTSTRDPDRLSLREIRRGIEELDGVASEWVGVPKPSAAGRAGARGSPGSPFEFEPCPETVSITAGTAPEVGS